MLLLYWNTQSVVETGIVLLALGLALGPVEHGDRCRRDDANFCADGWRSRDALLLELTAYPALFAVWEGRGLPKEGPPAATPNDTTRRNAMIDRIRMLSLAGTLAIGAPSLSAAACNKAEPDSGATAVAQPQTSDAPQPIPERDPTEELAQPRKNVQAVLSAYETLRGQLARDEIPPALKTAATLERAAKASVPKAPKKLRAPLEQLASSAQRLTQISKDDPAAVRRAFGNVSQALVALLNAEPALREGRHIFECPMAQGYKKWVQTSEQISNPYMGMRMPGCGSQSKWDQG